VQPRLEFAILKLVVHRPQLLLTTEQQFKVQPRLKFAFLLIWPQQSAAILRSVVHQPRQLSPLPLQPTVLVLLLFLPICLPPLTVLTMPMLLPLLLRPTMPLLQLNSQLSLPPLVPLLCQQLQLQ
jgi:hypothetical protein